MPKRSSDAQECSKLAKWREFLPIRAKRRGEAGHLWVGYDISPSMLKIARSREARPEANMACVRV